MNVETIRTRGGRIVVYTEDKWKRKERRDDLDRKPLILKIRAIHKHIKILIMIYEAEEMTFS